VPPTMLATVAMTLLTARIDNPVRALPMLQPAASVPRARQDVAEVAAREVNNARLSSPAQGSAPSLAQLRAEGDADQHHRAPVRHAQVAAGDRAGPVIESPQCHPAGGPVSPRENTERPERRTGDHPMPMMRLSR
jgi:hypothetical protein